MYDTFAEEDLDLVRMFAEERRDAPDAQLLDELAALPGLPDHGDRAWENPRTGHTLQVLMALAELCSGRRLRPAVPLLLGRACLGDPGGSMSNLRHHIEAIYKPDWPALTAACLPLLESPRAGTRLWTAHQCGVLRDAACVPGLVALLSDPIGQVRMEAVRSLVMICARRPEARGTVKEALLAFIQAAPVREEALAGREALIKLEQLAAGG